MMWSMPHLRKFQVHRSDSGVRQLAAVCIDQHTLSDTGADRLQSLK